MAKRYEEGTRRLDTLSDTPQQLDRHRGDAITLELGGYQTHGLITERSDRHQQRDVGAGVLQEPRRLGRRVPNESSRRRNRPHERDVSVCQ